jgi:hypothetical protein
MTKELFETYYNSVKSDKNTGFINCLIIKKILAKYLQILTCNLSKINKNIKYEINDIYTYKYIEDGISYYTNCHLYDTYKIGHDYILMINPLNGEKKFFSKSLPTLSLNDINDEVFIIINNLKFTRMKDIHKTLLSNNCIGFKNNVTIANYCNYREYKTKRIYNEIYLNDKLYLFEQKEDYKILKVYLHNDIIITKTKMVITFRKEQNFFGIDDNDDVDREKNIKEYSFCFFEYDILYDENTNKIISVDFNDIKYAFVLFNALNNYLEYDILFKYYNKFVSLIGIDEIYLKLNHPLSLLFIHLFEYKYEYKYKFNNKKFEMINEQYIKYILSNKPDIFYSESLLQNYKKIQYKKENFYRILQNNNSTQLQKFKFRPLQKEYIDRINEYIQKDTHLPPPTYEIIMGFGKSKIIIPYIALYSLLFTDFNQICVIAPQHLINDIYINILNITSELPLCLVFKQGEYNSGDKLILFDTVIKGIIVCSDITMKYYLLNENEGLINKNGKRLFIIDEIDDCINPLKSNFNILIENNTLMSELNNYESLDKNLIYNFFINCVKHNFDTAVNNINITKCIKKGFYDSSVNISKELFYLYFKTHDAMFILSDNIYFINKHYGFDTLQENTERFFYAVPYVEIDVPSINSNFNDIFVKLILTINLYIQPNFIFRKKDINMMLNFIFLKNIISRTDIERQLMDFILDYTDIKNIASYENIYTFNKNIESIKSDIIDYYLINIIIPNITFTKKYKNTSFLELLNEKIVDKYICFSGTTEYIGKIKSANLDSFPKINEKEITNIIKYKYKELDYSKIINFFNNTIFLELNENIIYEFLKTRKDIKCIIDCACVFRFKKAKEYAEELFNYTNKNILFFDEQHKIKKLYKTSNNTVIVEDIDTSLLTEADNFLIFYDDIHTRGTDIKLPNINGLCTITNINDSVNVMQGIYRLRKIGKGQSVFFLINEKLKEKVENCGLFNYLENNTDKYIDNQEKELILQTISANVKFTDKYVNPILEYNLIPTLKPDTNFKDILKTNYNLQKIIKSLCSMKMIEYCKIMNDKYINKLDKYDISTSSSNSIDIQENINLNIEVGLNISLEPIINVTDRGIYNSEQLIINTESFNIFYDYNGEKHSYFSFYSYAYLNNQIQKFIDNNLVYLTVKGGNYKLKYIKYNNKVLFMSRNILNS